MVPIGRVQAEGVESGVLREAGEDEERLDRLYKKYHVSIYRYAFRRLNGNEAEASDTTAEVFSIAWRRIHSVPLAPDDRLWLFKVAHNVVMHQQRAAKRREQLKGRLAMAVVSEGSGSERSNEHLELIRAAIGQLRLRDQELIKLILWDEMSMSEAAQILDCSENAVTVRFHRVKRRLHAKIQLLEEKE
jgi:RNA polymerase sigma-70 factor (ECF subfamily)